VLGKGRKKRPPKIVGKRMENLPKILSGRRERREEAEEKGEKVKKA
jgi:hypothetical protein